MSKVSRSVYQKVCEENKQLKNDIESLVDEGVTQRKVKALLKWQKHFYKERQFNESMKIAVKEYLKEHPEYDIAKQLSQ